MRAEQIEEIARDFNANWMTGIEILDDVGRLRCAEGGAALDMVHRG